MEQPDCIYYLKGGFCAKGIEDTPCDLNGCVSCTMVDYREHKITWVDTNKRYEQSRR